MGKILPRIDRNKVSGVLDEDGFPFEKVVGSQMLSLSVEEPIRVISDVEYMLSHALNKQARPSLGMIGFIKRPCQYEYVQGVVLSLNEKGRIAFQITPRIEGALGLTRNLWRIGLKLLIWLLHLKAWSGSLMRYLDASTRGFIAAFSLKK